MVDHFKKNGFTLLELLIVMLLLSVVFFASATVYVSALKFFAEMENNDARVNIMIAMEHMVRKLNLANSVVVDQGGQQLKLSWDYALGTFAPNNTPGNSADDTWVKFRIIGGRLYWRNDAAQAPDVSNTDAELIPGLVLQDGSGFTLINPTSTTLGSTDPALVGDSTVVNINLVTQMGNPPKTQTVSTNAVVNALSKN